MKNRLTALIAKLDKINPYSFKDIKDLHGNSYMTEKQYLQAKHSEIDKFLISLNKPENHKLLNQLQELETLHTELVPIEKELSEINSKLYQQLDKIGYFDSIL